MGQPSMMNPAIMGQPSMMLEPPTHKILIDAIKAIPWQYTVYLSILSRKLAQEYSDLIQLSCIHKSSCVRS